MNHTHYYDRKTQRAVKALKRMSREKSVDEIADDLGVWPTQVRRALAGKVGPTVLRVLVKPRKRVRFAADVSPELRAELRAEAEFWGGSNGELLEAMWMRWNYPLPGTREPSDSAPTGRNTESEPGQ